MNPATRVSGLRAGASAASPTPRLAGLARDSKRRQPTVVVNGITGAIGLEPTLAALGAGDPRPREQGVAHHRGTARQGARTTRPDRAR